MLTAVGPNIGVFKMVAAADPLATALGINLAAEAGDQAPMRVSRARCGA